MKEEASKYQSGMMGVYLVAAELTHLGFIVSPTLRNAAGADLLVTDQNCQRAWSVQVKANSTRGRFWLVGPRASKTQSQSHVYVFVTLKGKERPDYHVVPSDIVAANVRVHDRKTGSTWHSLYRKDIGDFSEAWVKVFGHPGSPPEVVQPK